MSESTLEPNLKMLVWNVRWGKQEKKLSKLNERSEIGQYDIICLIEAYKPRDYEKLQTALEDFSCLYMENKYKAKSREGQPRIGGISIFVKKQKASVVHILDKDKQGLVKWLKIDGKSFDFKADVYVCVVYLPVPGSMYWGNDGDKDKRKEKDFFKMISDAVNERKSINGDMVIVAGDFNCRIGNYQDRDSPDKGLLRNNLFQKLVTDSGNLFILNGRDEASRKYTCHIKEGESKEGEYKEGESSTVVDYALVSDYHRSGVKLKVGAFGDEFELKEFHSDHRSLEIVVTKADKRVYHAALNEERDASLDKKPISSIGSSSEEECFIICDNCKCEINQTDLQISDTRYLETVETNTDEDLDVSDAALNEKNPMSSSVPSSEEDCFIMCDDCKCEVPQADRSTHEVPVLKQPDTDIMDAALKRDSKLDKKIICDNCKCEIPQADLRLSTHEVDVLKQVNRLLKLYCEECAVRVTGVTGVNCRNE